MTTLFIDYDFISNRDGAATRSKFLLKTLLKGGTVDLLLFDSVVNNKETILNEFHVGNIYRAETMGKKSSFLPDNLTCFSDETVETIRGIVTERKYDTIFVRFYVHDQLISKLRSYFPRIKFIVDVDLLFSSFCLSVFKQNPTLETRYYLLEHVKHKKFEKNFFKKDYVFLFSNQEEMNFVKSSHHFYWVTNPIIKKTEPIDPINEDYILLYGNLDSTVMKRTFESFLKNIYPKIKNPLEQLEIKIHVVGTGSVDLYQGLIDAYGCSQIEILGEVSNIKQFIKSAQLVLFPVNTFSGTLTRLMETIECQVPIVATEKVVKPLGLEMYIPCSDNHHDFSRLVIKSLLKIKKDKEITSDCYDYTVERFGEKVIAQRLENILEYEGGLQEVGA